MIDLHCHLLPGIDDGARDLGVSLEMARLAVADGVKVIACTPHILPGLYENTGPQIRQATQALQQVLDHSISSPAPTCTWCRTWPPAFRPGASCRSTTRAMCWELSPIFGDGLMDQAAAVWA